MCTEAGDRCWLGVWAADIEKNGQLFGVSYVEEVEVGSLGEG